MHDPDQKLLSRARRAYERGRLIVGLRAALLALAVVGLPVSLVGANTLTLLAGLALVLATGLCAFHGRALGNAAQVALAAGVAGIVGLLAVRIAGGCTKTFCESACLFACLSGGLAGGALVLGWCVMRWLEAKALTAAFTLFGIAAALGAAFARSEICAVLASMTGVALAQLSLPLVRSTPDALRQR